MKNQEDDMSRVVQRNPFPKLKRSNSHENIPLRPLATVIHSTPTAHGAGQLSFGARDDTSIITTSTEHVVSSPFQSAASALAVLDELPKHFGAFELRLPDPDRIRTLSFIEQKSPVGQTKDLSLPIDFLPGEDDIKLKADLTYRSANRKATYQGELLATKYRLLFVTKSNHSMQVLVDVPLGMISQIEKIGGQTRSNLRDRGDYGLEIRCKDLRHFFFANSPEQHQRRHLFEQLTSLIFPFSIIKADMTNALQFFSSFFAWNYKQACCANGIDEGWTLYNKVEEYRRMGIQTVADSHWKIDTEINQNYNFCDTYPNVLAVPCNFDSDRLHSVALFRSRNRIPVLSWYCRKTYVTITRSSQPLTGLNRKNPDDMEYLQTIADTNTNENSRLYILDARPKVNAIANKANGGGYEDYPSCDLEFHNIQNIHVMRESLNKLYLNIRANATTEKTLHTDSDNSQWLTHIRAILTAVLRIVALVNQDQRSVLVHCSDGWDRTTQLTSLSMLMLDGYYRTLNGFLVLIEKEWISFGHKFFLRIGHADKPADEQSPVFLQFLDCTYQLMQQFPSAFEFNENLLENIADSLYSCQYGTFLLNSEKLRTEMQISEYTMSAWTPILRSRSLYMNSSYHEKTSENVLYDCIGSFSVKLWENYYYRYVSAHRSTLV